MRNSLTFFRSSKTTKFTYVGYDCCESLGNGFKERNVGSEMHVAIPVTEMDEFFMINNKENLKLYLEFITDVFGIKYELSSEKEITDINMANCGYTDPSSVVFIKISVEVKNLSNKYFNAAYNTMRYLWYQMYTNMAIIATNLYKLKVMEDNMDILAIAFSYQNKGDRAVLPSETISLQGLLFFRTKEEVIKELQRDTLFNTVFYRYPIYFDPTVVVKGSFFEDAEASIKAKVLFSKLAEIMDINDIPSLMIRNINLVYDDYLAMKQIYLNLKKHLDSNNYSMDRARPLLLSKTMQVVTFQAVNSMGNGVKVNFNLHPEQKENVSSKLEEVELPF
jgi:hypothetical protein